MPTPSGTAKTQPSLTGLWSRRYGSFAGKTPAGQTVGKGSVFVSAVFTGAVFKG